MPLKTLEIRWFSNSRSRIYKIYKNIFPVGLGDSQNSRTDLYLKTGLKNTGIKVREGNHEFKLKIAPDIRHSIGTLESWAKWSHPEHDDIRSAIKDDFLSDWLAVTKKRWLKNYSLIENEIVYQDNIDPENGGCQIEFTEVFFPSLDRYNYTLGFEVFGKKNSKHLILDKVLTYINWNKDSLQKYDEMSYPAFLTSLP